jgi:hypothetical protein
MQFLSETTKRIVFEILKCIWMGDVRFNCNRVKTHQTKNVKRIFKQETNRSRGFTISDGIDIFNLKIYDF